MSKQQQQRHFSALCPTVNYDIRCCGRDILWIVSIQMKWQRCVAYGLVLLRIIVASLSEWFAPLVQAPLLTLSLSLVSIYFCMAKCHRQDKSPFNFVRGVLRKSLFLYRKNTFELSVKSKDQRRNILLCQMNISQVDDHRNASFNDWKYRQRRIAHAMIKSKTIAYFLERV